jgi:uncharacterized protein (TIRG00374 family)
MMSFRGWISIVTIALIGLVVFLAWPEIYKAFLLLGKVNIFILFIMVPVQLLSYFAAGEIMFSYLREKGHLKNTKPIQMTRLSLELNFVNHVLPSGGIAGVSYLAWRLKSHGVTAGRATMAQIIDLVVSFLSFTSIMIFALIWIIIDNNINRTAILLAVIIVIASIAVALLTLYFVSSAKRLEKLGRWASHAANFIVKKVTFGKKKSIVKEETVMSFLGDIHEDYIDIKNNLTILKKPFYWSFVVNIADAFLFYIAFMSFGVYLDPAALFIAFGLAQTIGSLFMTPGGTGAFEMIMITFLVSSGVKADIAIAGTILARVILVLGTIIFGYIFYQLTIIKYGKHPINSK